MGNILCLYFEDSPPLCGINMVTGTLAVNYNLLKERRE